MIGRIFKSKDKNTVFLCQVTENSLKVLKCARGKFVGLEAEAIAPDENEKSLVEKLGRAFHKLGYSQNPVIISIPRNKVTCRYLKVPTQIPQEIEKIVALQVPRYLPFPASELITGYQIISTDKQGYTQINLIIVHRDVINYYDRIFKELKPSSLITLLSSYGLSNIFNYIKRDTTEEAMVIDIDLSHLELAIVSSKKVLFSRYLKIDRLRPDWENLFISEVDKTRDAYLKEVSKQPPSKIFVTGSGKSYNDFAKILQQQGTFQVEALSYDRINFSKDLLNAILVSDNSFASLMGLGLREVEDSLNLLSQDLKENMKRLNQRKDWIKLGLFVSGIIVILSLGMAKSLGNKGVYLKELKEELNKISKDAKPLEEIEKRMNFVESRMQIRPSALDALYEIYRVIPAQISLNDFSFEEANQVILRGQTQQLNFVFGFASELEKSRIFKEFNVKVRYATKKTTVSGEIIDFEIACVKEK